MAISRTSKILLIVGGILIVLLVVGIIGIALLAESMGRPTVENNSVLVLKLSGDLPDYVPEEPFAKFLGIQQQQSFSNVLTQLRKAKIDNRISAVVLDIDFPEVGWGKADELRDAVKEFKSSGKPVYAYMEIGTNREYYLATSADKIFLPPSGDLYVNGFAAEAMFYKGSLDKLGIEADVIQIGPKYKNAPDQYTKKEMGEGQREVINAIVDEYYGRMSNAIVETRKKNAADIQGIIDNAP
jgi:protease-4